MNQFKKHIISFLILFFLLNSYSQNFKSCKEAKKKASYDFKHNEIKIDIFNRFNDSIFQSDKFDVFFENYLFTNYNLKNKMFFFDDYKNTKCYNEIILKKIKYKHGNHFIKKTIQNAKKSHKEFLNSNEDSLSKFINSDKIYYLVDSRIRFKGNDKKIMIFLENLISNICNKKEDLESIRIDLTISTKGIVTNCKIISNLINNNKKSNIKNQILLKINSLGKWIPAYLYNQKVNSTINLYPFSNNFSFSLW